MPLFLVLYSATSATVPRLSVWPFVSVALSSRAQRILVCPVLSLRRRQAHCVCGVGYLGAVCWWRRQCATDGSGVGEGAGGGDGGGELPFRSPPQQSPICLNKPRASICSCLPWGNTTSANSHSLPSSRSCLFMSPSPRQQSTANTPPSSFSASLKMLPFIDAWWKRRQEQLEYSNRLRGWNGWRNEKGETPSKFLLVYCWWWNWL